MFNSFSLPPSPSFFFFRGSPHKKKKVVSFYTMQKTSDTCSYCNKSPLCDRPSSTLASFPLDLLYFCCLSFHIIHLHSASKTKNVAISSSVDWLLHFIGCLFQGEGLGWEYQWKGREARDKPSCCRTVLGKGSSKCKWKHYSLPM